MEYASATVVSKSQNIELDYLAYDAFSIETQLIEAQKGYFVHITQDNEFVADGIISDVRPDKKTQKISIRPIQALFDSEIFYDPISNSIQWLADTITAYYVTNTDTPQNRPIDLTFTLSADSCSLIENFKDVGDTVNLLSVIETALKTYSVVVDTWIDMSDLRIKVNIYQQTETKELEADLENVLESDVTLGDSYGSINKVLVRKYDYVETTSGGETTKEVRVLGDFEYYRLSDDSIVLSTDTYDQSLRIFPVFWDLILIEKTSEMTDAEWLEEALSQATEVLTPETYDQEIILKYHKDDKLVRPMDIKIGTIVTVHLKGETYTSILAAKRIEGNTVTLTLGAVRTELTKKLSMDRIGGGTSGGGGGGASGGAPGPQGVGISSVVQTTTSYVSEGENIVTVTKTDGSTSTFSVRNGAQGAQGTAAGFGTPTATANTLAAGASATASVTASGGSQAKIFNFTFGIPKGDTGAKGDTGDAAGFANPTATATTLSPGSAAAASVTASGGNTMKQFDFSFGIPQGEKGDKGDKGDTGTAAGFGTPTASATTIAAGSSATASVTASGSDTSKIFNFTFGIPKGDTGATGPTGPTGPAGSSIQSIARTSGTGEAGSTDTYTITLTNGNTTTFQVKNGNDGRGLAMRKATLTANGWSNNSQTVQISASASAASDFLSIPEAETNDIYAGAGVKMTSVNINEGTVDCTFTCTTTPTADVDTVILVSTSNESIEEYLNGIVDDMTDLYNQTEADFDTASGLYVKKAGDTMTGPLTLKGEQYSGNYGLNANNSDIVRVNRIAFSDKADNANEGIDFWRDSTHWDTIWAQDGTLLFTPNRSNNAGMSAADSQKVARFPSTETADRVVFSNDANGGLKTPYTDTDATNLLLNSLSTGASTPTDNDYYISQYAGGGTTTTTYHRRPVSALWEYIRSKISSVLGLTASNYSGTAASASSVNPANITDGYTSTGFYLNTHPEAGKLLIPFINNDIAYLTKRGGTAKVYYDGVEQSVSIVNVFDGSPSYWAINPTGTTEIIIELTLHATKGWTNTIYIDFGSPSWRAKSIKIEVMNSNYASDTWTVKSEQTNYSIGEHKITFGHTPVGASNAGGGFNKIRFTFSDFATATIFRIACLGLYNYGSSGLRETFLPKDGGEMYGGITPYLNNSYNIGSSSKVYNTVYATSFNGTATRATADASGNNIKTTYLNGGSISVTPSTTTVNSITAVGSLSSLTFTPNSTSKNMTIAWNAGTLPTKGANTTVATGISSATFTGTHPS